MRLFSADIPVFITVYVKTNTEEEARKIIKNRVAGAWIKVPDNFDDRPFSEVLADEDPDSAITYSPAMTVASWEFMHEDLEIEEAQV